MGIAVVEREPGYKERVGSDAFNLEYLDSVSDASLRDDIVSYLGEYRLKLQKYDYPLRFSDGKLRDIHEQEPMSTKAQRAVTESKHRGSPTSIEEADLQGILTLENQLRFSHSGDTIFWASPPGPKEQGYGDYGFMYVGKVKEEGGDKKSLSMTAIRVEKPTLSQFNDSFGFITGRPVSYSKAEEFIGRPVVINNDISMGSVDQLMAKYFSFRETKNNQEMFNFVMRKIDPMIPDLISVIHNRSSEERIRSFNSIENYTIELKKSFERKRDDEKIIYINGYENHHRLEDIVGEYNYKPPVANGNCKSTESTNTLKSNNVFNRLSSVNSLFSENSKWFVCPKCGHEADGPIGNECPGCGLTKEDYAEESGEMVCD